MHLFTCSRNTRCLRSKSRLHVIDVVCRLITAFKDLTELWQSWDDVTILINHQTVAYSLWMFLSICHLCYRSSLSPTTHTCLTPDIGATFRLDVEGMAMYIGHIFQNQDIRETFGTRQGPDAQVLIDLVQGVRRVLSRLMLSINICICSSWITTLRRWQYEPFSTVPCGSYADNPASYLLVCCYLKESSKAANLWPLAHLVMFTGRQSVVTR
jgi:hypothetical protein